MEISRAVLAVLLLLTIIISGLGTWSLLSGESAQSMPGSYTQPGAGEVSLKIGDAPDHGLIALNIVPREDSNG